jgi:hypothetical protein
MARYRDPGAQVNGRESLRANLFYSELADWELAFTLNPPNGLPTGPVGDSNVLARQMIAKYRPMLEKAYALDFQQELAADLADATTLC